MIKINKTKVLLASILVAFVLLFSILSVIISGYATTTWIDYSPIAVQNEDKLKFTKITEATDGVRPAFIIQKEGVIYTNPREHFDISKDGTKIAYMG